MKNLGSKPALVLLLSLLLALTGMVFSGCGNKTTATTTESNEEEAATPEDTVAKFFRAMEKQDASALAGLFDPDSLKEIKEVLGKEYKSAIESYFFLDMSDDVRFKSIKYDTEIDGKEAVVDVVRGKVTYTDEDGEEVSEDLVDSDDSITFYLVKVKDKWYISVETFPDLIAGDIPRTEPEPEPQPQPNPNPNPKPAAEYVTCPDCAGWGGWEVDADTTCPYCNGAGVQDVQDYCYNCGGTGWLEDGYNEWACDVCGGTGIIWDWVACEYCWGSGLISEPAWIPCETCEGSGWVRSR